MVIVLISGKQGIHQPTDSMSDPWYIGYGMDDENGHNRNLGTIYTI